MDSGKVDPGAEEEEGFGPNKDTATSASNNTKDGKRSGKTDATTRSKHSVTEQRRRSKINERFQILRELIPNSDQKRDTASFLFEVIQYVQFLQEKVTKYEGSYRPWSSEPTKLMPWRNNHWRSLAAQSSPNNPTEPDHARAASCGPIDLQAELPNKTVGIEDRAFSLSLHGPPSLDETSVECSDALNLQDGLAIEGGTISISSVYSNGLLSSVAQALESTGVDLSQANVSVQVNLGKRAHAASIAKVHGEDLDQSQKRRKL